MLRSKIQSDLITALKSHDQVTLTTLRFILSQIKNKEIEKKTELDDQEVLVVFQKAAKELKESIDAFTKGNRKDLIAEYQKQLDVVLTYLPAELSDEDLKEAVKQILEKNKEIIEQNPKVAIGICMKELKTKAASSRILKAIQLAQP